jgi:hypothetical protein
MLTPIECRSGRALECIGSLFQRNNIQARNYVSYLSKIFGLSLSQARRMLDKDITEWSLGDVQKVYHHFNEDFVCFSRDQAALGVANAPEDIAEATIAMPSRSLKCQVVLDGKLTGHEDEHQWVAYRKDGGLVVSERVDAPKDEVLFKISKVELALKQNNAFAVAVCDDNKDLADSLGDFLREYGFSPSVFNTVADVEKAIADQVFDAFVLDWRIGNQTSESLIRLIRLAKSPTVPIFLITGQLNQGLSTETEIAEVVRNYRILPRDKPIRPSILAAEILSAIQYSIEGAKPKQTPSV